MVKKPRKTFLKLLSHSTLSPLEETRQLLHLSAMPDKKPFRCAVEYLRSAMIAALHPLNSLEIDLNDFDQAITFCIENRNSKEYKAEIAMLHACTRVIEADSIDAWHVNLIVAAFIDLALKNERGLKRSKGGSKPKRSQGIMAAIEKILKKQPHLSAERLWSYFEDKHKGQKKALKINGFKVYFKDTEKGEFVERLYQISSDKVPKSIGRSAFAGYVKSAKKTKII